LANRHCAKNVEENEGAFGKIITNQIPVRNTM
jgi:hypothetical protein